MSDVHSVEEAYEQIAEAINYLSEHGEVIILISRPGVDPMISGYSGGVKFNPKKRLGEKWQTYKEG